jgi:iron(III) transport system substrate-binding protein
MKTTLLSTLIASGIALATLTGAAQAKGRLVVYCSATNEMCEAETKAFGDKYDVKTSFIRNGSGSTLAKVDAEKKNPQADVWYGGTLDPQSQAGEMGLLQPYKSKNLEQIMEKFRDPAKVKGNLSSAVYVGILGFGVNTQRLKAPPRRHQMTVREGQNRRTAPHNHGLQHSTKPPAQRALPYQY